MRLGIRTKFIGILVVAAGMPLCIGIITVWVLGSYHYRREKGVLFETLAIHLAQGLNQTVDKPVEELDDWLLLSDLYERINVHNETQPRLTDAEFAAHIREMEARWPGFDATAPELRRVLANDIARRLEEFRLLHPLFAEIFVTDGKGQLVAATGKTSDYWQADEAWWQRGIKVGYRQVYAEGISYDDSAQVYSIDVAIPIRDRTRPAAPPVGVLKGVLNISPLFSTVQSILSDTRVRCQLVDTGGRVVFEIDQPKGGPLADGVGAELVKGIAASRSGWTIEKVNGVGSRLIGFTRLQLTSPLTDKSVPFGIRPLYVIVHDDISAVLAPVRRELRLLSAAGGLVVLAFTLAGLYIANSKIIMPVQRLRSAAQLVAASAKLAGSADTAIADGQATMSPASTSALHAVRSIHTADEIEDLAHDFVAMAVRVLRYHEQLEEDLALKTAEIQCDLQFAREFQEALMPHSYPQVPSETTAAPFALHFHHIYKPASSVGGDFFDVLKLDDHRAGVFIADVMGHGARSALVTAILRTLLQDLTVQANDPAQFLELMNQHFFDLVQESRQFIFVSAFYLIVDTQKAMVTYASAGHPSPLVAERRRRTVRPLIQNVHDNPALGLFRESRYTSFTSFAAEDDVFLLYTDGITEAANTEGEEFGRERLGRVLEQNLDLPITGLVQSVIDALNQFTDGSALSDDICLVAVEVAGSATSVPAQPVEASAAS